MKTQFPYVFGGRFAGGPDGEFRIVVMLAVLVAALAASGLAQTQDDLFDITTLQEIRLTVNPADWTKFKANPLLNDYYPADFLWRGIVLRNVGIRQRGTGSRSGIKPYIGFKFDQYVKGQQFLGLQNLRIKNSIQDASFLHERLGMLMYRRMGVPAPREAYARLYINDEYSGLYVIVEEIDNKFLDRVFGEHGGCYYNYNWIDEYRFEYLGDDPALYAPDRFEPKSCLAETDPASLIDMVRAVNQTPDDAFQAQLAKYLDASLFLKHLAVENFTADGDAILGYAGMNNFYMYRLAGTERFEFIAWDKDETFDDAHHSIWYNIDTNVLTRRMFQFPDYSASYQAALRRVAVEAGGSDGWLQQELDRAYNQIHQAALEDPFKPYSNADFESGVQSVRNFLSWRKDYVVGEVGPQSAPEVAAGGVVNGASYTPLLVAGGIGSIFGTDLGFTDLSASALPLPMALDQTSVEVNGEAVPLFSVSPFQVNFQVPWELSGQTTATIAVTVGGVQSAPQSISLAPMAPALFMSSSTGQGAIVITSSGELAAPAGSINGGAARPVHKGESVSIYSTGLGNVANRPSTGDKPPGGLCVSTTTPVVTIGGVRANVAFSGLAPGTVGLYIVNAEVPEGAATGNAVPVSITMGGAASNTVTVAIE